MRVNVGTLRVKVIADDRKIGRGSDIFEVIVHLSVMATYGYVYTFLPSDFIFRATSPVETLESLVVTALPATNRGMVALDDIFITATTVPTTITRTVLDAGGLRYHPPTDGTTGVAVDSFVFVPDHGTATMSMFTMAIDIASTPVVQIAETPIDANEGDTATLTLRLDRPAPADFYVDVRTQLPADRAEYPIIPEHFIGARQVHFGAGRTDATIEVMALDDEVVSTRTDVALTLLPGTGYEPGAVAAGEIRFADDGDRAVIGWRDCEQPLEVREDDGMVRPVIAVLEGLVSYAFDVGLRDSGETADRINDYTHVGADSNHTSRVRF